MRPATPLDKIEYEYEFKEFTESIPPDIYKVVHLGAISDSGYVEYDMLYANALSVIPVAKYVVRTGAEFIFFSSSHAIHTPGLYGWSKRIAEEYLRNIVSASKLCIIRPYNIYGGDESEKINPSIVWKFQHVENPIVYEDCYRDFIHVEDVCDSVATLFSSHPTFGGCWQAGTYEFCTGRLSTWFH